MENNIIDLKELEKAQKRAARREWFKEKEQEAVTFVEEHKEAIAVLAPVVIGGCAKLVQLGLKTYNLGKQEDLKNLYVYDRSLGHYWKLRRELDNSEWVEIEQRRKNGEKLGDILNELNVLA